MISIRAYEQVDFPKLAQWWVSRTSVEISPRTLSETGFVASDDVFGDICAIFLYPIQGSEVCWIGWPISDPESPSELRDEALDAMLTVTHEEAKNRGYGVILTTTGIPAVGSRLEKHGYNIGDTGIAQYWKEL